MNQHPARPRPAHRIVFALALAAATLVASSSAAAQHLAPQPPQPRHCLDLAGVQIPASGIGLPTDGAIVQTATPIGATAVGNQDGDYCRLTGVIRATTAGTPDIRFELNLPARWNRRALQFGGGGYNGVVVTGTGPTPFSPDIAPLAQGYATFGDDSGHIGNPGEGTFGLLDEAVTNFGYAHLKKVHDVARALIVRGYGRSPDRMYFAGGSTGGREAYTVIQRYPDDYDGVIANAPALNFTGVRLMGVALGHAEYRRPGGFVPPRLLERVYERTLQVCDALDGVADGIVSDVEACRAREPEIIDSLRCPAQPASAVAAASATSASAAPLASGIVASSGTTAHGASASGGCLTESQLATLELLRDGLRLPYPLAWNVGGYRGYNVFQGTRFTSGLGLAHSPHPQSNPEFHENGYLYAQGDAYIRYFVTRDTAFDAFQFDVMRPGRYQARLVSLSKTIGAMNPDLSRFIARGGKLITMQGLADEVISPNQTIAYYDGLVARYGQARVDSFMRFYMAPGFQHGNGVFIPSVDMLGALDRWVSHDISPETLLATDILPATNGRTRPLCRYPGFPRYVGRGNVNRASSFVCAMS
ncbi:tannase/feruloyl esterase family alpha/beta hydrolase [Burkholderia sp. 3C]